MEITLKNMNFYLFEKLNELLENGIFEKRKVILFGINSSSYCTKNYLEKKGIQVDAFIDNDRKKCEEMNNAIDYVIKNHLDAESYHAIEKRLIRAYQPEELLKDKLEDVVILIASKYYSDMCRQLNAFGYEENLQIFQTVNFYDLNHILDIAEVSKDMHEIEVREIKKIQLQLLRKLKQACEENHLRYYLCGGTLLGAVRHKGYIPWDDDIDVAMPLEDYKNLIRILQKDESYMTLSVYTHADSYYNFFMKMIDNSTLMKSWEYPFLLTSGVSIDIFPLFGLPNKKEDVEYFYHKIRRLNMDFIRSYIESVQEDKETKERRRKLQEEIIAMMEQYDFDQSKNIGYLLSKYKEKEIMKRSIYQDQLMLEFEKEKFAVASGYKEYLKILFKNYMELPPEKERYNTHNYKVFQ